MGPWRWIVGLEVRLVVLSMYSIKGVDVMRMYWCFVGGIFCGGFR